MFTKVTKMSNRAILAQEKMHSRDPQFSQRLFAFQLSTILGMLKQLPTFQVLVGREVLGPWSFGCFPVW